MLLECPGGALYVSLKDTDRESKLESGTLLRSRHRILVFSLQNNRSIFGSAVEKCKDVDHG
eukprot:3933827-Rhodomonas_salina.2